jgi:hypothetical protein
LKWSKGKQKWQKGQKKAKKADVKTQLQNGPLSKVFRVEAKKAKGAKKAKRLALLP